VEKSPGGRRVGRIGRRILASPVKKVDDWKSKRDKRGGREEVRSAPYNHTTLSARSTGGREDAQGGGGVLSAFTLGFQFLNDQHTMASSDGGKQFC